ncbi:MAG TPA: hypothetical protein VJB69_00115 [Candidatus Paceibacterota bacterium]
MLRFKIGTALVVLGLLLVLLLPQAEVVQVPEAPVLAQTQVLKWPIPLPYILSFGGLILLVALITQRKRAKELGGEALAAIASKSKFVWGLVIVGIIIALLTVGWKPISDWWPHPAYSSRISASKPGDHWELCWEKHQRNSGINPAMLSLCSEVMSLNLNDPIMTIETVGKEGGGSFLIWDKKNPEGIWYRDLKRTERGGSWGLTKVSDTLWAGYQTTRKDEKATMTLRRK